MNPAEPPSVSELDELVSRGQITFDQYWDARIAAEERESAVAEEGSFDLRDYSTDAHASNPNLIGGPPPAAQQAGPPPQHASMVAPPPPPAPGAGGPVRLPFDAPSRDAASTRANDSGRRRRFGRRR